MESSCRGDQACFGLEGRVHQESCLGSNSCKNLGTNIVIGKYRCTSNYACENNQADIGDCYCSTENSCANNTSPISASYESCPATVSQHWKFRLHIRYSSRNPIKSQSNNQVPNSVPTPTPPTTRKLWHERQLGKRPSKC